MIELVSTSSQPTSSYLLLRNYWFCIAQRPSLNSLQKKVNLARVNVSRTQSAIWLLTWLLCDGCLAVRRLNIGAKWEKQRMTKTPASPREFEPVWNNYKLCDQLFNCNSSVTSITKEKVTAAVLDFNCSHADVTTQTETVKDALVFTID